MNFMVLLFLNGCTNANQISNTERGEENNVGKYQRINAEQAKDIMDNDKNIIVLDVRTAEEYVQKHVPRAILLPNEKIDKNSIKNLPKDKTILVYCRSGHRSKQAAEKLLNYGYQNVIDFGGIIDWPYDTESGEQ